MTKKQPETPLDPEAELNFTGCTDLRDCLGRVGGVLQHANTVHANKCQTRGRALNLLGPEPERGTEHISDSDAALIVANAIFPNHCNNFFNLKIALYPKGVSRLDGEVRSSLSAELIAMKHDALVLLLGL